MNNTVQTEKKTMQVAEISYPVEVIRKVVTSPETTKLATVSYITTDDARDVTRVCLESIQRFTTIPYELWVVDNGSPKKYANWLKNLPNVNVVLNQANPITNRRLPLGQRLGWFNMSNDQQLSNGSMANAVGLELAAQAIDPRTERLFIMHNDVLAHREGWLEFLLSKFNDRVRGAAVRADPHPKRVSAMHASGCLFDFSLFERLNISFLPNLPNYDVGDHITLRIREEGYEYFICQNTVNNPKLQEQKDELYPDIVADRAYDDAGQLIFMHLGRGTLKGAGKYSKPEKTYSREWVRFAEQHLLSGPA